MYWGSGAMLLQEVTYATITLELKGFAVLSPDLVVLHEANMAKAAAIIILIFFISIIIQRRASFAPIIDKHYSYCLTYNHNGYFLIKSPVFTPVFHIASNSDIAP